jgi:hypothetical protein
MFDEQKSTLWTEGRIEQKANQLIRSCYLIMQFWRIILTLLLVCCRWENIGTWLYIVRLSLCESINARANVIWLAQTCRRERGTVDLFVREFQGNWTLLNIE